MPKLKMQSPAKNLQPLSTLELKALIFSAKTLLALSTTRISMNAKTPAGEPAAGAKWDFATSGLTWLNRLRLGLEILV